MRVLGEADTRLKAQTLADAVCTTPGYMPQVIGPLVKAGWVRSDAGPTGGYSLAVSLEDVSLLQVIEAVEGPTDDGQCVLVDRPCEAAGPCALHVAWYRAREHLLAELDAASIAEVALTQPVVELRPDDGTVASS